jgi:hypothetical protein
VIGMKKILSVMAVLLLTVAVGLASAEETMPGAGNAADKTKGDDSTPKYTSPYRYLPDPYTTPAVEPGAEGSGAGGSRDNPDTWLKDNSPEPKSLEEMKTTEPKSLDEMERTAPGDLNKDLDRY